MYVYMKTEPTLWTVGFYNPNGRWIPESDHDSPQSASERVHYLNGNNSACECEPRQPVKRNLPLDQHVIDFMMKYERE